MQRYILLLFLFSGLIGCKNNPTKEGETESSTAINTVVDNDTAMNEAIQKANQTLTQFNEALKSNNPDFHFFSLKTRFATPKGGELIWVSNIKFTANNYIGIVDNLPEPTSVVKIGDTVQISSNNICDWMYAEKGRLRGGFTILLLRNRMTESERTKYDQENGLFIEE